MLKNLENLIHDSEKHIGNIKENYSALGLPSYLADLEISSINLRINELKELRDKEESPQELELTLYPDNLPSGQVDLRIFVSIMGGFQNLTDNVANTLLNKKSSTRGPIPQEIQKNNSWILKNVKAGSFIAVLDLDNSHQLQIDNDPQKKVISELFNLISSEEEETIVSIASSLGIRTIKSYIDWMKIVKDSGTPINLNWKSSTNKNNKTINLDPSKANKIQAILNSSLDSIEIEDEVVELEGILTGINIRTQTFEFSDFEKETFTGRVISTSIDDAIDFIGQVCRASFFKTVTRRSTGSERISWTLLEIYH